MSHYIQSKMKVGELEIDYIEAGSDQGPVIVFAHGLGGNWKQWQAQIDYFTKYRMIAFSLHGHGDSSKAEDEGLYSIERYADSAIALLKALHISSCIWIGNSMGGVIGYELIKREPQLISHLITNGTVPVLQYNSFTLKLIYLMDKILISLLGYEKYIDIAVKATLKDTQKQSDLKSLFMAADPKAIIASHQVLGNYDYLQVIQQCNHKIDFLMTPKDTGINKIINRYRHQINDMPKVVIHECDHGGHVFNMEDSKSYNYIVESLIQNKNHDK